MHDLLTPEVLAEAPHLRVTEANTTRDLQKQMMTFVEANINDEEVCVAGARSLLACPNSRRNSSSADEDEDLEMLRGLCDFFQVSD